MNDVKLCIQCPDTAKRFAHSRGLCPNCYGRCHRSVRDGKTTWAKLEKAGQALPPEPPGTTWGRCFKQTRPWPSLGRV